MSGHRGHRDSDLRRADLDADVLGAQPMNLPIRIGRYEKSKVDNTFATAAGSSGSTPARSTARVTIRYMAPVSRYPAANRRATRRATVDFPVPEGPSIAITNGRRQFRHKPTALYSNADLHRVQLAQRAGSLVAELHVADLGADQPRHRMPDLGEQPSDDVLAPLVQDHLDDGAPACNVDHLEVVDLRDVRRPARHRRATGDRGRAGSVRASPPCRSSITL